MIAQNGQYDVRLAINTINCVNTKLFVDIEVRAVSPTTQFNIADQNYRISFNRNALANPVIDQELTLSSFIQTANPPTTSFYSPHTLVGSKDTIISYNVGLSSGDGYPLDNVNYTKVGRIAFDILDLNACLFFKIHTKDPNDFPNTIITAKNNTSGDLYETVGGDYGNYYNCSGNLCANSSPIAKFDGITADINTPTEIDVAANDIDPEGFLDPTSVTLLSTPPSNQGTVTVDTTSGILTFTPAQGFLSTVTTFQYQICDLGRPIPVSGGNLITTPVAQPDPMDPPIFTGIKRCSSNSVFINVQTTSRPIFTIKALIEGAFDTNEMMNNILNLTGSIPTSQPYNTAPWNYDGPEAISSIPTNIVDWVMVTIRSELNNITTIDTAAALLRNDGQITNIIGNGIQFDKDFSSIDSVYIAVYHRNHIGIMSARKVGPNNNNTYIYDFTTSENQYFGGNNATKQVEPGTFSMIGGDYDGNGQVQNSDLNAMNSDLGLPGYRAGDLNLNGQVQNSDVQELLIPNLGKGASFQY